MQVLDIICAVSTSDGVESLQAVANEVEEGALHVVMPGKTLK
jgi:hypothetical protein